MKDDARRLPVIVLTGFLGAGKSTLLSDLAATSGLAGTAVLINEFGEVAVDHHLVEKIDESLVVLDSGCICCSVRGDLVRALKNLFQRAARREIGPVERVLIETTGLADPAPVVYTLMKEPFIAARFFCDGVITAVDVTHIDAQLKKHRQALSQVAMADRLLLTKCDLIAQSTRAGVAERLARLNPAAPQIEIFDGKAPAGALSGCGLYGASAKRLDVVSWLGVSHSPTVARYLPARMEERPHHRHDERVTSCVLVFDAPLDWLRFSETLEALLAAHGEQVLRVKGLLNVAGDSRPRVVQCVQHAFYPPSNLSAWPTEGPYADGRSRLVFIVQDLHPEEVARWFADFMTP